MNPGPLALLARPRALLGALLVLTALLVPLAARLRIEGNVVDLLPRSSVAAQTFATFTRRFTAGQELIVLVTGADPARLLRFADDYAQGLARLPQVRHVSYRVSRQAAGYLRDHLLLLLSDEELEELSRRVQPEALRRQVRRLRGLLSMPGGGAMAPLLTADPLELLPLISERLASGLAVDPESGYFRSRDGRALVLKVRPRFDPMDWARDEQLLRDAAALAERLGGATAGAKGTGKDTPVVAFTGSYAFPPYYKRWLEDDLALSTTVSLVSVLLLFALFFRALRILPWVLLPLSCAGVWSAAAAALLFQRVSGVSIAFGTILVAIGIDLPIQLYNRLREELLRQPPDEAVRRTIAALGGPAVLATLGPAVVFFCCGLSDYRGLGELGVLAGLGLCLNCGAMLTIFPALLLCLPLRLWHGPAATEADRQRRDEALRRSAGGPLLRLGALSARRPFMVLGVAALLFALALPQALRLGFEERLFALEPRDMPPQMAQEELSRRFGDRQGFLLLLVEGRDREEALERGDRWLLELERLRRAGEISGYESLSTLLPSAQTQERRRATLRGLDLPRVAAELRVVLEEEGFDPAPFAGFLARLQTEPAPLRLEELRGTELGFLAPGHLAEGEGQVLLATYMFVPVGAGLPALLGELRRSAAGIGGGLSGRPLLERELQAIIARDMTKISLASVAAVALLLVLCYRRARPVLAVLLPLSLAWVLFAALLRTLGLKLNLYNLLAVPLCIGYGIDDHVFLVHRQQASRDPADVLLTTGRAIVLTTLSTTVGFLGLLAAHFPGLRLLALSGALAVLLCLLAAFLVLPALLSLLWPPRRQ